MSLVVDAIATARLTRLVVADAVTQPLRARIIRWAYERDGRNPHEEAVRYLGPLDARQHTALDVLMDDLATTDPHPPKLAVLVKCRWCVSVYVGLVVLVLRRHRWWRPLAEALIMSHVAGLAERLE